MWRRRCARAWPSCERAARGAMRPCVAAVGAPLRTARRLALLVLACGQERWSADTVRECLAYIRAWHRETECVYLPSPTRRMRVLVVLGLVACPAAPLAVSFAPGLLGPAASAGPLLRRMREVGVTHLAAVPQSDATVQHCADMYAVAQPCHVRSTRAHLLCTVRTGQLGAQLPREVPVLTASPGTAGGAGAARERRPRRHHQPVADWRA